MTPINFISLFLKTDWFYCNIVLAFEMLLAYPASLGFSVTRDFIFSHPSFFSSNKKEKGMHFLLREKL